MNIDIWSDIVCPWCYLGKRRFEKSACALRWLREDVTLHIDRFSSIRAGRGETTSRRTMLMSKYRLTEDRSVRWTARWRPWRQPKGSSIT